MDLDGNMVCEISQKKKTNTVYFTFVWNLTTKINKQNKTETDSRDAVNNLVVTDWK